MEIYNYDNTIRFGNKHLPFWDFSNMSYTYPVECCGMKFKTSEHLFFALRFSGSPDIQKEVIEYTRSITFLKRKYRDGKAYKPFHFAHWDEVCVDVMKYIIRLKYEQNKGFQKLLDSTKGMTIIEDTTFQSPSKNNVQMWGAVDEKKKDLLTQMKKAKSSDVEIAKLVNAPFDVLVGENILGKILMEIRDNKTIDYIFKYPMFLLDNKIQ